MPSGEDLEVALRSRGLGSPSALSSAGAAAGSKRGGKARSDDLHEVKEDPELLSRIKKLITLRK